MTTTMYGMCSYRSSWPSGQAQRPLQQPFLVAVDVAHADRREHLVAHLHLAHDPLEGLRGTLRDARSPGVIRCGTSAKWLSSTRFGSMSTIRTSSGVARIRIDVMKLLTRLDLPAPVAPAMSTCGIVARFTICARPWTSLPRPTVSGCVASLAAFERSRSPSITKSRCLFGTSMPIADFPGIGAMIRTSGVASAYAMSLDSLQHLVAPSCRRRPRSRTS